ncbi:hypothetical protein D3C87_2131940 [compost metagenome]
MFFIRGHGLIIAQAEYFTQIFPVDIQHHVVAVEGCIAYLMQPRLLWLPDQRAEIDTLAIVQQ